MTSMLDASGPQAGQHGDSRAVIWCDGVDSVLRADPRAPLAHARSMAMGRVAVKTRWPASCLGGEICSVQLAVESPTASVRVDRTSLRCSAVLAALLFATTCAAPTGPPVEQRYMHFLESLVASSGMVRSRPNDDFTTAWKNALAAMAFLHEGNAQAARGILDVFSAYQAAQGAAFRGVPQGWDAAAAGPLAEGSHAADDDDSVQSG